MRLNFKIHGKTLWLLAVFLLVLQGCSTAPATQSPTDQVLATATPAGTGAPATDQPTQIPQPTDTPVKPTQVAVVTPDSQVRRLSAAVFAGNKQPLPELTNDLTVGLGPGGMVTTSAQGEAEVLIQGCLKLFVFQDVTLQRSACRREDAASGLAVCSAGGMTGVLNQCASQVDIQTPSSTTRTSGTWFAVIYLPDDHLSIIQVYEGAVNVSGAINVSSGQWTPGARLEAGNLWFSAPGAEAPVINGVTGREAQPMEVWQALRPELIDKYPNLDIWMEAARQRAGSEDLVFPDFLAPQTGQVSAYFTGPLWTDSRIQRAVITGVDWGSLMRDNWFEFNITPRLLSSEYDIADARGLATNRDEAIKLLTEAGYYQSDNQIINIVSRETDFNANQFAFSLASALSDLKIQTEVYTVGDESFKAFREGSDPGANFPFILLDTSGDAFANN